MRSRLKPVLLMLVLLCALPLFAHSERSGKWPKVRADFLEANPKCIVCGRDAEEVHHLVPFHTNEALELEPSNLRSLCHDHHFGIAHLSNFSNENPDLDLHARILWAAKQSADAVRRGKKPAKPTIHFTQDDDRIAVTVSGKRPVSTKDIVSQLNAIAGGLVETSK